MLPFQQSCNPAILQYYGIALMTADPPKYRPLERFWPYAELPEQPTDAELAALDPDLYEALFGAQTRPFSITLVFPALDVPAFAAALEIARASAEFRETGTGDGAALPRAVLVERRGEAARSVSDRRRLGRHRGADRRSAGAVRARAVAAARLVSHSAVGSRASLNHRTRPARLEADLKQLEAEYNMFFSGRLPKPPWETRARVEALVKQFDRGHIPNTGDRFRFTTLQSRYATFIDLWDRGLRAREEGRPGPFAQKRAPTSRRKRARRIASCTSRRSAIRCARSTS